MGVDTKLGNLEKVLTIVHPWSFRKIGVAVSRIDQGLDEEDPLVGLRTQWFIVLPHPQAV